MRLRQLYLIPVLAVAATTVGIVVAPSAAADDCNYGGGEHVVRERQPRGRSKLIIQFTQHTPRLG